MFEKVYSLDPGFSVCSPFMNLDDLGLHLHLSGCTSRFWPFLPLAAYQLVSLAQHAYLRHPQDQTSSSIPEKRKPNSSCSSVGMVRYGKIHGHISFQCASGRKLRMKKDRGDIHKRYLDNMWPFCTDLAKISTHCLWSSGFLIKIWK